VVVGGFFVVNLWCFGALPWWANGRFSGAKNMPLGLNFSVEIAK
jgi:hypothetical protein